MAVSERSSTPDVAEASPRRKPLAWKPFALRQFILWHWVSAGLSLIGMLLFAVTGITLNHAADIPAAPVVRVETAAMPAGVRAALDAAPQAERQELPPAAAAWLRQTLSVSSAGHEAEWTDEEIYLSIARPGGNAVISIDRAAGEVELEDTWRGWIAYFNDLHKGRHTGLYWSWFIDVIAAACVIFCLTGLGLLWLKAAVRPATWPAVGLGLIIPILLALFFIHS